MNKNLSLDTRDSETVLMYFTSEQRKIGYKGLCAINITRLAEIHLSTSIQIANNALKKAQQAK